MIGKIVNYLLFRKKKKQNKQHFDFYQYTNLPEWVSLLREDLKVFLSQLDGGQGLQPEVGPTLDKLNQRLKGVQTQTVVAIVRQVGHEDTDLN